MERLIGRLMCSQVIAMVFVLGWAACPMVFAVEPGKQVARQVVTDKLSRIPGSTVTNSPEPVEATVKAMEYSSTPDGVEIVTLTLEDGTITYTPSTGEFEFVSNDGQVVQGSVAIGNLDRVSGNYTLTMTLDGGEAPGTYDLEANQIDEATADATLTVAKRSSKRETFKTRAQTAMLIPNFESARGTKKARRDTEEPKIAQPGVKHSTTNAMIIYPPVVIVGGAVVVIVAVEEAVRGDSPYDCTTAWSYFWNGCWIQ